MPECAGSAPLAIGHGHDEDARVLTLRGDLDLASAPWLERELVESEAAGEPWLVVDLGDLDFMDCSGVHVLLEANRRARANGHALSLRRGPRTVQRVFELTQTVTLFQFDE